MVRTPVERDLIWIFLYVLLERAQECIHIAVFIDQEVVYSKAINQLVDRIRISRFRFNCRSTGLPEHFTGVSGQDPPRMCRCARSTGRQGQSPRESDAGLPHDRP